jgi:hypothetical protein
MITIAVTVSRLNLNGLYSSGGDKPLSPRERLLRTVSPLNASLVLLCGSILNVPTLQTSVPHYVYVVGLVTEEVARLDNGCVSF